MQRRLKFEIIALLLWISSGSSVFAAWKVAIFDYDDRLHAPNTIAKYIETTLLSAEDQLTVEQYSGKANEQIAVETLKRLDQAGYDLIITITSDALILAHHFLKNTPTLYTNVNNPLFLGVMTLDAPGRNMSGASYYVPIADQIAFFQQIQPPLKRLGFLFDEKSRSSKTEIAESRAVCRANDLEYAIRLIAKAEELPAAARDLIAEGVDAIIVTSSEKIYTNLSLFQAICDNANIPIYSYHKTAVQQGAIASLTSDYYRMAEELIVPMALQVLREGVSPGAMPVAFLENNLIIINQTQAQKLGLTISDEILQQATAIF
ncbi:ABC-type uncharacterized transport system, periplasmic component [Candidatus Vecturithrix granuli]|uniref:ABC-type uncharacterized transport system, periplasmic component n=1 Tax=Vecturithrix granuli TaxID=1499967 RepID=A0A081BWA8_VECG1|nr:ABC-type uncharacterized transport system, periplasmic component [Candidatus Vecturithrix granuli]